MLKKVFLLLFFFALIGCSFQHPYDKILAYPNPFDPDKGSITFELSPEVDFPVSNYDILNVRIYNVSGRLVWEREIRGNSLFPIKWNGYVKNGERASSGIYYVFFLLDDSSGVEKTKRFYLEIVVL